MLLNGYDCLVYDSGGGLSRRETVQQTGLSVATGAQIGFLGSRTCTKDIGEERQADRIKAQSSIVSVEDGIDQ